MAAPASVTIANLTGTWTLNKSLSDPIDPALSLQGIGWLLRKGIGAATVTLMVKQYTDDAGVHIDIDQLASGMKGTTERRTMDWSPREHKDWLFGRVDGRSRFITVAEAAALCAPGGEARAEGWVNSDFIALDWIDDEAERTGPDAAPLILGFVSADAGWTGTQTWGFQMIGGERRYVRNVVIAKGPKFETFKMIYDYVPA